MLSDGFRHTPDLLLSTTLVATYHELILPERPPLMLKRIQYQHFASASWVLRPHADTLTLLLA